MACADEDGAPIENDIISMSRNSHTLYPKIVGEIEKYPEDFKKSGLENLYLVDFPGMFESRGPELDIAMSLALQRVLV